MRIQGIQPKAHSFPLSFLFSLNKAENQLNSRADIRRYRKKRRWCIESALLVCAHHQQCRRRRILAFFKEKFTMIGVRTKRGGASAHAREEFLINEMLSSKKKKKEEYTLAAWVCVSVCIWGTMNSRVHCCVIARRHDGGRRGGEGWKLQLFLAWARQPSFHNCTMAMRKENIALPGVCSSLRAICLNIFRGSIYTSPLRAV